MSTASCSSPKSIADPVAGQWPSARKIWQQELIVNRRVTSILGQNIPDRERPPCRGCALLAGIYCYINSRHPGVLIAFPPLLTHRFSVLPLTHPSTFFKVCVQSDT